jgi:hypothetical protein
MSSNIKMDSNRIINITVTIILILFTSIIAPKLPKSFTKYFENSFVLLIVLISVTYFATRDIMGALIAIIALAIIYQSIIVNKISDRILNDTKNIICNKKIDNKKIEPNVIPTQPVSKLYGMDSLDHLIPDDSTLKPHVRDTIQDVTPVQNIKVLPNFSFDSKKVSIKPNDETLENDDSSNLHFSAENDRINLIIDNKSFNYNKNNYNLHPKAEENVVGFDDTDYEMF